MLRHIVWSLVMGTRATRQRSLLEPAYSQRSLRWRLSAVSDTHFSRSAPVLSVKHLANAICCCFSSLRTATALPLRSEGGTIGPALPFLNEDTLVVLVWLRPAASW